MNDNKKRDEKLEVPKVNLYGGIDYWSKILVTMDKKLEVICQNYGFGELGLTIVIHNGNIMYSIFSDKIKIKETDEEKK